jgi:UDP-3-O-[3-hydroxymyristoyl] glucosamine N-acyltransferase
MPVTLQELAAKIGATLSRGKPDATISAVGSLAESGPQQVAVFFDPRYADALAKTHAGAVISKTDEIAAALPAGSALLVSPDPEMAFVKSISLLHPEAPEAPGIDPRAVVEPGAVLGTDVFVGPGAVVRAGSRIGARSRIYANAVVGRNCKLGEDCRIHSNAALYDNVVVGDRSIIHSCCVIGADGFGYKFRGGKHVKVPQIGNVEIGSDVEIGANTCIDRGALDPTRIGDGTKIDNLVQIGHGVRIGKHCILCGQAALAGSAGMDDYAVIGGQVGVADHIFMGKGSKAGAKTGVGKDVPPGQEIWGLWGEERRDAFKMLAAYRRGPEIADRVRELEKKIAELEKK